MNGGKGIHKMLARRVAGSESRSLPPGPASLFKRIQLWEMALLKVTFRIDIVAGTPSGLPRDYVLPFLSEAHLPRFRVERKDCSDPVTIRHICLEISIISCFISNAAMEGAVATAESESNRQVRCDSVSNVCEFSGHCDCFTFTLPRYIYLHQAASLRQTVCSENSRGNGT